MLPSCKTAGHLLFQRFTHDEVTKFYFTALQPAALFATSGLGMKSAWQ
jgi:hypothetical protein